jgi:glycosyltransferase involved in cell wall biosynthesis
LLYPLNRYFDRFGFCDEQIREPPSPGLGMVVVIPCFNEPRIIDALQTLWNCERPASPVEIVVVINSGESASAGDLLQNEDSLRSIDVWRREHQGPNFRAHILHFPKLRRNTAGVGLARKIGMDEALRRFDRARQPNGVIACFDADCVCDGNYLIELERYFQRNPKSPGCGIYFEHPLEGPEERRVYEAIIFYELHLRYYVEGLRHARFPHAFHTIGSSMAVRADAYLKQGGMNKRKAGEDFYFLHKIIPLGGFGEVNTTRVIPSPRVSDRVPFGTGQAVGDYLASGEFFSYPFQAFLDLRILFEQVSTLFDSAPGNLPQPLADFLASQKFSAALDEVRSNTSNSTTFTDRFFRWFDGFLSMKYIHFARDHFYGRADVVSEAKSLICLRGDVPLGSGSAADLLRAYRVLQRIH